MVNRAAALPALLALLLSLGSLHAQGRGGQPPAPRDEPARTEVATAAEDKISQTTHTVRLDGRDIKYTATTGTLPIRLDDGRVAARMFFVAYTRDGEDVKTRPVSFLYNGGPGAAEYKAMAQKVARFSGLSAEFVELSNLRITAERYRKELLRDKRLTIGRLDGRFTSLDLDAAGERQEFDISNTALQGAYTALFQDYVKNELKWESDLHYPTSGNVQPWTYTQNRYMDMTEPLRSTMTRNPFLKVFVAIGYYDMATVMGGVEFNFTHLAYDKPVTDRVSYGYYEAGHMIYIRPSAHKALTGDVSKFIQGSRGPMKPATSQP